MAATDRQMRSLTVCKVALDASSRADGKSSSKLKSLFKRDKSGEYAEPDHLVILTCDRLTVLHGDDEPEGGASPLSTGAVVVALPLMLVHSATVDGATITVEHQLVGGEATRRASRAFAAAEAAAEVGTVAPRGSSFLGGFGPRRAAAAPSPGSPIHEDGGSVGGGSVSSSGGGGGGGEESPGHSFHWHFPVLSSISRRVGGDSEGGAAGTGALRLRAESEAAARELAAALRCALNRLLEAYLWLDKGLPLDVESSLAVATVAFGDAVVGRAPMWGATLQLPAVAPGAGDDAALHIDLSTPMGPCHAAVPVAALAAAAAGAGRTLTITAERPPAPLEPASSMASIGFDDASPGRYLSVTVTLSVTAKAVAPAAAAVAAPAPAPAPAPAGRGWAAKAAAATALGVLLAALGVALNRHVAYALAASWGVPLTLTALERVQCALAFAAGAALWAMLTSGPAAAPPPPPPEVCPLGFSRPGRAAVYSVRLMHAEIVEGPGEEAEAEVGAPAPAAPLARALTRSITRHPGVTAASSRPASGGMVDVGAVTMRRVLTRTTTTVSVVQEVDTLEARVDEAAALAELAAISPAVTPALLARYVVACGGDADQALSRLRTTAEWRRDNGVDEVLASPIPHYHAIKAAYLHAVVGWTRPSAEPGGGRRPVIVEGMGRFKAALVALRKGNISVDDMIYQFVFFVEWVTRDLIPEGPPGGSFVRIYDLKGLGLMDLADKEALRLGQAMMDMLERYYPERMAAAYVVNTPSFFATAWKMVKPLLDPRTAKKIHVLSSPKATLAQLREIMDDADIPVAYGGTGTGEGYDLGYEKWLQRPEERTLAALVGGLNATEE